MIADEVDHRDEHRRNLWDAQRVGTWGYKAQTKPSSPWLHIL